MHELVQPPHSIEAEQSVIGGILLDATTDNAQQVLSSLKAEAFYSKANQLIFAEMQNMNTKQQIIDMLTLSDSLDSKELLQQIGGFAYIAEITKNTPSAANIVAYAGVVRDKAMARYSIAKTNEITELLYANNGMSSTDKIEAAQTLFAQITDHAKTGKKSGLKALPDVLNSWIDEVEQRFSSTRPRGLSTGIQSLDEIFYPKGIVKGSLFVIGARPKMGKTTILSELAINCAMKEKLPAVIFSLEMPQEQIFERMIGQYTRVNTDIFYRGADNDSDFARANAGALELAESGNLFIDDTPAATLAHVVAESRRIKREKGVIGMIMIDYLTLMKPEKAERNDLAYGLVTKGLKNLAKELDCVVVLLTQLNRGNEQRGNKRPLPSDSRDTGQIEQDCDYWLGIHKEGATDEKADQHLTELLLRLNRHGKTGVVYVEQKNGAIYDLNQVEAEMRVKQHEEKPKRYSKEGGF